MSTLTVHCQWEDEMAKERTGHLPSYAEAKKMKSLTLHTHSCFRVRLMDCSSSSSPLSPLPSLSHLHLPPPSLRPPPPSLPPPPPPPPPLSLLLLPLLPLLLLPL